MEAASSGELRRNYEEVAFQSVLKDFHADLDPIDAEDFDVVKYINEVRNYNHVIVEIVVSV